MSRRLRSLVVMVMACLLMMPIAHAYAKTGSITLELREDDELTGGKIALYCVAIANHTGRTYYDVSAGQFASSPAVANIPTMSKEELEEQNSAIATALENEARAQKIEPLEVVEVDGGLAEFSDVPEGLYLLFQTELSEDDRKMNCFLMSIPDDEGELLVVARPKFGVPSSGEEGEDPAPGTDPWSRPPVYPEEYFPPDVEVIDDDEDDDGSGDEDGTDGTDDGLGTDSADGSDGSSTGSSSSSGSNGSGSSSSGYGTSGTGTAGSGSSSRDSSITLRVPQTADGTASPAVVALAGVVLTTCGIAWSRCSKAEA